MNINPWESDELPGLACDLLARVPSSSYDELWQLLQDRNYVIRAAAECEMAERSGRGCQRLD